MQNVSYSVALSINKMIGSLVAELLLLALCASCTNDLLPRRWGMGLSKKQKHSSITGWRN